MPESRVSHEEGAFPSRSGRTHMLVLDPAVHSTRLQHTVKLEAPIFVDGRESIQIHMAAAIGRGGSRGEVGALLDSAVGHLDCRGFGDLRH